MAPDAPTTGTVLLGSSADVRRRSDEAADDVEGEVLDGANAVFDVVAENPQEQHVAADVQQPGMQEHRHEQRQVNLLVREALG